MSQIASIATYAAGYFGTPRPSLRERVALLLAGKGGHGFAGPLTTPLQRARIASSTRSVTDGSARAVARWAGLNPHAAPLPGEAPAVVVCNALLYRKDADADGVILSVACAHLLIQSRIPAVDADSWLLAAEVAGGADVFAAHVHSA